MYHKLVLGGTAALLVMATGLVSTRTVDAVDTLGAAGPDVTVITLDSTRNYGASGGIRGYSVGTTSCNIGTEPLWWCDDDRPYCKDDEHPVIAQNLYRLKDGRFTQIGMSWLKHGFLSLNTPDSDCGNCTSPPFGGDQLGVGCTDTYGPTLNGSRPLGLRSEVNPADGTFPFPHSEPSISTVYDQRMRVDESDVDPAQNAGAQYWIEGHYIAFDDAAAGNALNNASYRAVNVSGNDFDLNVTGPTIRELAAIYAWQAADPEVDILFADVPSDPVERFHVARKKTEIKGGFHYEYAIHNMNSDRAARAFTVQFPSATTITETGFHNVPHHSGEPYATTDWDVTVDNAAGTVSWSTDTFADDENANALRWGTMFTFWFDTDNQTAEPNHSLGLFKEGSPTSIEFAFIDTSIFIDGFESGDITLWSGSSP